MNYRHIAYTDGAFTRQTKTGGYGAVIINPDKTELRLLTGGVRPTTNNRMELQAIIRVLQLVEGPVTIFSDSQYCCNAINKWMHGWASNNWRKYSGGAVKNDDLFRIVHCLIREREGFDPVRMEWVRGHNNDNLNEAADRLAVFGKQTSSLLGGEIIVKLNGHPDNLDYRIVEPLIRKGMRHANQD